METQDRANLLAIYNTRSRGTLPAHVQQFCYAIVLEANCRQRLEQFVTQEYLNDAKAQLAQALIMQGRYEEAREYATKMQLDMIADYISAREKDDERFCDCDAPSAEVDHVWSTKHQKFVKHYYCPVCEDRNIAPE